jgi:hypothetical protein
MGVKTAMGLPRDLFINPGLAEVDCHAEYFKGY